VTAARLGPVLAICAVLWLPAGATATTPPLLGPYGLTEPYCYNPAASNADYEAYGPTDVNAQAGDGRLTVNENSAGTLTVFKYPNPSYYNQIKYLAVARDARGVARTQFPNEGSFAGLAYRTRTGSGFAWLRQWRVTQTYDSPDTPVPVTVYRSPPPLGLTITDVDLVVPGTATLVRQYWVVRSRRSPVRTARLVYFENFNPIATRIDYAPIADWCLSQLSDQAATYDPAAYAIVNSWHGVDAASLKPTSVAVAIGFDLPDSGHQVGGDGYDPATLLLQPEDPYLQVSRPPYTLGGSNSAAGQTTGALALPLRFDRHGQAAGRVEVSAGSTGADALRALANARSQDFRAQLRAVGRDWHSWLRHTLLPRSSDARVIDVAKRTLITVRLAIDPDSGAIVASSDTQGPYGEDWIRDGSFINQLLDRNGFASAVTRHDLFYARVQTSLANPSLLRPPGNWAMTSYGDGIDGGPIPYEIDETGLGIWALASHAAYLPNAERTAYLRAVYPAITRAADYLVICQDPVDGLQCYANEDDNITPSQTLHGAETTELGLRSALAAAAALGDVGLEAANWRARLQRLDAAIAFLYDPATRSYREGNNAGNAYNFSYGDGGWLLWPVQLRPYTSSTMIGEASAVSAEMEASFRAHQGGYEGKALLGLAYAWSTPTPAESAELRAALAYMASALTTSTGLFGESWERFGGLPTPVEDMPHVWEHTLFYLSALQIDGARRYRFARAEYVARACRIRAAPAAVCAG
jgi:nucleotide-binding universal stress UspA family protein